MNFELVILAVLATITAFGISIAALWVASRWQNAAGRGTAPPADEPVVSFLFDDESLVDLTEAAQVLISVSGRDVTDYASISAFLAPRFPGLLNHFNDLGPYGQRNIYSADNTEIATLSRHNTRVRLTLSEPESGNTILSLDRPTLMSFETELTSLRSTTEHMPFLIWRQDQAGNITWVNRAYMNACAIYGDPNRAGLWPPCKLFDIDLSQSLNADSTKPQRHCLGGDGDMPAQWYQFDVTPLENDFLISAMNVNTVVEAEDTLRTFVQTLSKTFADLPIGLAVFTRDRRLALFNPALADLSTIPPEKLIMRPTLFGFFDMLRERQMMPEPKNYNTWRDHIVDLEASAADGTYHETWHLPYGRTFRVTGRPQIDGAVALLFEDISDEIGMNRRYRTELEVGQSVLDSLGRGMAVFSPTGVLTLTNFAYDTLWSTNTREGLDTLFVGDAVRYWSDRCAPSPLWEDLRVYVMSDQRDPSFASDAMMLDGRPLMLTARPLAGGSTLVQFQQPDKRPLAKQKIQGAAHTSQRTAQS